MRLVCSFLAVAALSALSLSVFSSPAYAASGNAYYIDSNSPCRSGCDGKSPARAWESPEGFLSFLHHHPYHRSL